jgi:hypothetical protein
MSHEYRFHIADSFTPETFPMERLADYLAELAKLLGEPRHVHFREVRTGSTQLIASIDDSVRIKVRDRVQAVREGGGPKDAQKAFAAIDEMLRRDNASGELSGESGAVVVPFPGRNRAELIAFGPIKQDGTLDGQIVRIGGQDDTVHVFLRDGSVVHTGLFTTPEVARRLAVHFLGATLRLRGVGTWFRAGDGTWELKKFKISDFEALDETPLLDVVRSLRNVKGSEWGEVPDPVRALLEERHGSGDAH